MGATSSLGRKTHAIDASHDSIVIVNCLGDIPGGTTLDVSGVASGTEVIKAGHVLIKNDTTKVVSPLGVSSGAYVTVPTGSTVYGFLKASVLVEDPRAAIMTMGQVREAALPYPVTSAIKSALPHIQFL